MSLLKTLMGGAFILLLIKSAIALRRGYVSLGSCPKGGLFWFHPMLIPALVLAPIFPPRGWLGHYNGRFSLYAKKGSTILSGLWVWYARPMFWLADAEAIKAVTSDRRTFMKDITSYSSVDIYGKSLVSTEGNEWRRHAAIAGPAFSEANNALVWKETLRLMHEWFSDELESMAVTSDGLRPAVTVNILSKMTQLTLHVIAAAGFGMRSPWTSFNDSHLHGVPQGYMDDPLPFHVALNLTLSNLFLQVLVPSFLYSFPFRIPWLSEKLSIAKHAFASMKAHMADIVGSVRHEEKANDSRGGSAEHDGKMNESGADLLRRLVQANDVEDESGALHKRKLTDNELFSNIFTFLLAGHETSGHTLSFAILLLALYPDTQTKARNESYRIWPSNDDVKMSSYKKDFENFEYITAFFRETLRCFPTEPRLIKLANSDTVLTGRGFRSAPGTAITKPDSSFDGAHTNVQLERNEPKEEQFSVTVQKGSIVMMDIWAVHMNPLVWGSDAHVFRPDRFVDTEDYKWPRDGFLAFSSGARGCIGQRFALAEAVCVLANLVRRYEILPAMDAQGFGSHEEFKRAMLDYAVALTIAPTTKFVKLRRLDKSTCT